MFGFVWAMHATLSLYKIVGMYLHWSHCFIGYVNLLTSTIKHFLLASLSVYFWKRQDMVVPPIVKTYHVYDRAFSWSDKYLASGKSIIWHFKFYILKSARHANDNQIKYKNLINLKNTEIINIWCINMGIGYNQEIAAILY